MDKARDPWWRLILDARISNEFHDALDVWYSSALALAALLDPCDAMLAEVLEDSYHLTAFPGCTSRLHVLTFTLFCLPLAPPSWLLAAHLSGFLRQGNVRFRGRLLH